MYSQMQGQIGQMEEALKDKEGTIETLERQLVQAGIRNKVMKAEVEINKKKEDVKSDYEKEYVRTEGEQKFLRDQLNSEAKIRREEMKLVLYDMKKDVKIQIDSKKDKK